MAAILVPFRGAEGKRRLAPATPEARVALGLAMLADVLAAAVAVADTTVVTNDEAAWRVAAELEVDVRAGVPMGQGAAIEAALRRLEPVGPVLVVNADLPCLQPDDLRALLDAVPPAGIAVAPAADGESVPPADVIVVGNVGDDLEVLGMHVSPDLDSILYALAGLNDEERGWGRADETWNALDTVSALGGETWFRLGDRDIGLHLVRTEALRAGRALSDVTAELARALGVESAILPATDDVLRTWIDTEAGTFSLEEWFVARGHRDEVDAVRFEGAQAARPAPGVLEAIAAVELLLVAPSNPFVSIGPILAVAEIRAALERRRVPVVAVSPLIGGRAVKGPADGMLARLAGGTSPAHVAGCYRGLVDTLVFDEADEDGADAVAELGVRPVVTRTLMRDEDARRRLMESVLEAAGAFA